MLLLTGATGTVGLPVLRRLTAARVPVRCLVRDPRRLGAQRVQVQIALRNALRGVDTVVHLASVTRDQPAGSIEELAGIAAWRLVQAADSSLQYTVFAPSMLTGPAAFATWDEAELLEVPLVSRQGTADAERLGVLPKPMRAVLGVGQAGVPEPVVSLRTASEGDLAFLSELASHELVAPFLMPGAGEPERLARLLGLAGLGDRPHGLFVIELGGDPVGALALEPFSVRSRSCLLTGLMITPHARRAGIALAAVRLACRRALVEYRQHRVEAETYGDNVAGQRLFERAGFRREGTRRQAYWRREQWLDGVLYGMLAEEAE